MGYTYTPTYYSGLQDTIASVCKSIFSRPGRRLTADQAAARRHADALKWQQESFHRILHLSALHREGIVPAADVQAFRASVLSALAAPPSPQNPDHPPVLRDKLLFLQELLRAKCISPEEFNAAKSPLAQRLAALGVAVDCPDADAGRSSAEEWAEIDLRDPPVASDNKQPKHKAFVSPWKSRGGKKDQDPSSRPPLAPVDQNHHASVLMAEISPAEASGKPEKGKRRHLTAMFGGENKEPAADGAEEEKGSVKGKKKSSWGFDGLKKWKKAGGGGCVNEDAVAAGECAPPRSSYSECRLEASPAPDAKRAKKKKLPAGDVSASDLANDKVLVEETKKELSRIQAELSSTNRNINFSDQQIETISTKLPMDKSDLNTFFPKAWCEKHGDGVIDAAKKEFKGHVEEMEKQREVDSFNPRASSAFEEDSFNPRAFSQPQSAARGKKVQESLDTEHFTNPFYDEKNPFLNQSYNN
ncbi:uncharacterized protein LOC124657578 [Lolium rigidum]|uniref:uncharacterized protein LOC124657578 n=1 Tax=Lolium rigidum TaxID=89674 RepID=UPI001F5E0AF9|nr:uncharacterized protein LOC124657578 [Lolium rigidum]